MTENGIQASHRRANDLFDKANRLRTEGKFELALDHYREVSSLVPDLAAPRHWSGFVLQSMGRAPEAQVEFEAALEIEPGRAISRHGLGLSHLAQARWQTGFQLVEARHEILPAPPIDAVIPRWRGESITGRSIVIWPEEGFGDQIQYSRYVKMLRDRCKNVVFLCRPELHELFFRNFGTIANKIDGQIDIFDSEFWVGSSSLPLLFDEVYVNPDPYIFRAESKNSGVGFMHSGNPRHPFDKFRSINERDRDEIISRFKLIDLDPRTTGVENFSQTLSIISKLDHIITVDTSVAHLSASSGRRTILLISEKGIDWRWQHKESKSDWYVSIEIVRKREGERWIDVIDRLHR